MRLDRFQQFVQIFTLLGRHRNNFGKTALGRDLLHEGHQFGAVFRIVDFVDDQQHRAIVWQQLHDLFVFGRDPPGFDQQHHHVDVAQGFADALVHGFVQRACMPGLKTRCINEYKLRFVCGVDASHPVARGLRLARSNADFLSHQAIEQGGLADVGAADNRDQAGAIVCAHADLISAVTRRPVARLPVRQRDGSCLAPVYLLGGCPKCNPQ